jgi:hypothetical protein
MIRPWGRIATFGEVDQRSLEPGCSQPSGGAIAYESYFQPAMTGM